jgi:hypothetical protein
MFTKRLVVLLLLMAPFLSSGQERGVTLIMYHEPLSKVLQELSRQAPVRMAYDNNLLDSITVTCDIHAADGEEALRRLLKETPLRYRIIDNTYVIYPVKNTKPRRPVLCGTITDSRTGEVLPYANILLKKNNTGTSSNIDGRFSLPVNFSPTDTLHLYVKYLGYSSREITIPPEQYDRPLTVELSVEPVSLGDVTVRREDDPPVETGENVGEYTLNPGKLIAIPNLGEVDIFSLLQLLPGISSSNEAVNGLSLRGSTADQNLLLFDGYSLYKQDHCFGLFSSVNPNIIKNIRVYKSAFEPRYGGKVGGIIDITGKTGNQKKLSGHVGVNTISANAMIEVPLFHKKGSFLLAARRSFTDVLSSPLYKDIFNSFFSDDELLILNIGESQRIYTKEMIPDYHFYDVNAKFTLHPGKKDVLAVSVTTGKDKLFIQDDGLNFYSNNNKWGNDGLSIRWGRQWNGRNYTEVVASISSYYDLSSEDYVYYDTSNIEEVLHETMINNNRINETGLRLLHTWQPNTRNKLESGLELNHTQIRYLSELEDSVNISDILQESLRLSGFSQYTVRLGQLLRLVPGLRGGYDWQTGHFYFEPRFSAFVNLTKNLYLKGAAGRYYQFMSRTMVPGIYGGYSSFWVLSDNDEIPVLKANHYVAGLHYRKKNLEIDVELYRKEIDGITRFTYTYDSLFPDNGIFLSGTATVNGLDILVKNSFGHFTGWLGYTLSRNRNLFEEMNRGDAFPANNDKKHQVKMAALYKAGHWNFSATWVYGSGAPYTPPPPDPDNYFLPATDNINSRRLPDFHRLDISITYHFSLFREKIRCSSGLSVVNLYNRHNLRNRYFFPDINEYGEFFYVPIDVRLPGFTPSIFLNVDF